MTKYINLKDIRRHILLPAVVTVAVMVLSIMVMPYVQAYLSPEAACMFLRTLKIGLVASVAWLALGAVSLLDIYFRKRFDMGREDNLKARKIQTQIMIFKRLLIIFISVFSFSIILLSIDDFRQIGTSILASFGVAGIVVGLSAQRTVGTFLAGIHLALSQPIRIDDVIVAEGEWGRVEEITFTFVVLRLWDSRRLVLPTTYFLEKPFQNWTRVSADLAGTAFFQVDFTADVEQIRQHFFSILETTALWDGKGKALHVTECSGRSMELRALMTAANSSAAWDLRCLVREKIIEWLRAEHPDWIPRTRTEIGSADRRDMFRDHVSGDVPFSSDGTQGE